MPVTSTINYPENCIAVINFGKIVEADASGTITKSFGDFTIRLVPEMNNEVIKVYISIVDSEGNIREIQQIIDMAP